MERPGTITGRPKSVPQSTSDQRSRDHSNRRGGRRASDAPNTRTGRQRRRPAVATRLRFESNRAGGYSIRVQMDVERAASRIASSTVRGSRKGGIAPRAPCVTSGPRCFGSSDVVSGATAGARSRRARARLRIQLSEFVTSSAPFSEVSARGARRVRLTRTPSPWTAARRTAGLRRSATASPRGPDPRAPKASLPLASFPVARSGR